MIDLSTIALLVTIGLALGRTVWPLLVGPAAKRLGDRFAVWLVPDDRAATYRLARGVARFSIWLAPKNSAAAAGAVAVLAEIDEIQHGGSSYGDPLSLARSLVLPAFAARCRSLAVGAVASGLVVVLLPAVGPHIPRWLLDRRRRGSAPFSDLLPTSSARCVVLAVVWYMVLQAYTYGSMTGPLKDTDYVRGHVEVVLAMLAVFFLLGWTVFSYAVLPMLRRTLKRMKFAPLRDATASR